MSTFVWFLGSFASAGRVGLLLDFAFWGLHFASCTLKVQWCVLTNESSGLTLPLQIFMDLCGRGHVVTKSLSLTEQYPPCSLSRCRYETLGELESGRDLGATGHHSGMLGLCWRPRLDSAWLGLTRLDYRSHTEVSKRFDMCVNVCQEFSMIRYFFNNSRRTPSFKKWQE